MIMDIKRQFGRNVRSLRLEMQLSQDEFGAFVGIHRTYVSELERGAKAPTIIMVDKIAEALNISVSELLAGCGCVGEQRKSA